MRQMLFSEYLRMQTTQITLGASESTVREHRESSFGQEATDEIPSVLWPRGVSPLILMKASFQPASLGKFHHLSSEKQ